MMKAFLALLLLLGSAVAQVELGAGGYVTERPADIVDPPEDIYRGEGLTGPVPTNRWWSSLVWTAFSEPIYAGPLSYQAVPEGLALGYPRMVADEDGFAMPFAADMVVGLEGFAAEAARVVRYGDWTVEVSWEEEAPDETRALYATLGQGLPYAYLQLAGGPVLVTFRVAPEVWLERPGALGITLEGRHYGLFYSGDLTLDGQSFGGRLDESDPYGMLSVAALPEASEVALERFEAHAFTRPTGSRTTWQWLREEGVVEVTFALEHEPLGDSTMLPLMGLYPHQWKGSDVALTPYHYETPRGVMKLAQTDRFSVRLPYTGVLPALPLAEGDSDELRELLRDFIGGGLYFPLFTGQTRMPDSYADGKSFGKLAALLPIAEQLGEAEAAETILAAIRDRLESWFTPDARPLLYYHEPWGALIAAPTSHGLDYSLNDHAFHYGYFLQAAASVAERDPDWVARWGRVVELLVRDTAGGRDDPMFPFLRALDPYPGHGWASGGGRYERGNNLESSSEAVNFAAGLIRWADAVGDNDLLELGVYLYATQVEAVWEYWFAYGGNFPEGFPHTAIGILWSDGGAYTTWWTSDKEAVHGINFLPITASSLYLGRERDFVLENYRHMLVGSRPHYWPDIALAYLALADPEEARALWNEDIRPEFGETRARLRHWLGSLAAYGLPEGSITADTPQYAVLERDGARAYLVYNPASDARQVRFSDGTVMDAVPGELTV
ncbi:MAG: glycosyl hydrolase, partial [Deinococcota bacterium]|nr:glycosyl hydrolase [Deinococcota bacterium]